MSKIVQSFVKVTGWPIQWCCFRTKVHYEDKKVQGRGIKGPAIIISNHTSVYDYAVMLYVFRFRYLRYLMAELLFKRPFLGKFLKCMGGIKVDRYSKTSMNRLYAVGETACNGVHGKNRLASNSLLESLVFAKRAASDINLNYNSQKEYTIPEVNPEKYKNYQEEYKQLILNVIEKEKNSHE